MIRIVSAACLIAECLAILVIVYRTKERVAGRLAILSPSIIFLLGVMTRYGLGGLIMSVTPEEYVHTGEFAQYLVSWTYSGETSLIWMAYLSSLIVPVTIVCWRYRREWVLKGSNKNVEQGMLARGSFGQIDRYRLLIVTVVILTFFMVGSISSSLTGSLDRGEMYSYWVQKAFRPEAVFIATSRIRQLGYLMMPAVLKGLKRQVSRVAVISIAVIPLGLEILNGGRGAVLYPVIMMLLGVFLARVGGRKGLFGIILTVCMLVPSVPYIAAYRDSSVLMKTTHSDVVGRVKGFLVGVEAERIMYRFQALGREVYACSDAYLFRPENREHLSFGFTDINPSTVVEALVPRWLSNKKSLAKYDGSGIAQTLIGTDIRGWFPCITTPGDLWRRGGLRALVVGRLSMGFVICALDGAWLWIARKDWGSAGMLLVLLPASYIQSGMYGTLRELIWQVGWELPKYIVICIILGEIVDLTAKTAGKNLGRTR